MDLYAIQQLPVLTLRGPFLGNRPMDKGANLDKGLRDELLGFDMDTGEREN